MTGFLRSANGQGHVASDGPNGHVPFSCLEVDVVAENVTSVAEKEMNGCSESSFVGSWMSRALQISCMRACWAAATWALPLAFVYGAAVGVAVVSSVVVRTPPLSVA